MRILIAEDDEDFRHSLSDLLSKAGHAVEAVGDGLSALRMSATAEVLVADMGIPGLDGLELLSQARRRHPELAVVVMTGCDTHRSRQEAFRRGALAYLPKPFGKEALLRLLRCLERPPGDRPEPVSATAPEDLPSDSKSATGT